MTNSVTPPNSGSVGKPRLRRVRITGKELFRKLLKVKSPCELLVTLGIGSPSNIRVFYSLTMEEFLEQGEEEIKAMGFEPKHTSKLCKALHAISLAARMQKTSLPAMPDSNQ